MRIPPPPEPRLLLSTTPTGAEALRTCWLRVAFEASPAHASQTFRGPSARLGTVCHRLLAAAGSGSFDGLAPDSLVASFDVMWCDEVRRQEEEARASPLEHHLARAGRWPFYQLKRFYTSRAVQRLVAARAASESGSGTRGARAGPGAPQFERLYEGFGGRLRGRIDHVEYRGGQPFIVDYKSGTIFEDGESAVLAVRASYQRQLRLYAALHWDKTGLWPAGAELVSLRGERAAVAINPPEALALVEETLNQLDRYNEMVRTGTLPPASPAADVCRHCPFKAMCGPFWRAVGPSWNGGNDATVAGMTAGIQEFGDQGWSIDLDVTEGNREPGRFQLRGVTEARFGDRHEIRTGQRLRIIHARRTSDNQPRALVASERTELWWMAPGAETPWPGPDL